MKKNRFEWKSGKQPHPSRAKLDLYPRFEKFKLKKRKAKRRKENE